MSQKRTNQLSLLPNARWCPDQTCRSLVLANLGEKLYHCSLCNATGCVRCGEHEHRFTKCNIPSEFRQWEKRKLVKHVLSVGFMCGRMEDAITSRAPSAAASGVGSAEAFGRTSMNVKYPGSSAFDASLLLAQCEAFGCWRKPLRTRGLYV